MTIFTQLLSESQSTNSTRQLFWSFQSSFKLSILFAGTVDFFFKTITVWEAVRWELSDRKTCFSSLKTQSEHVEAPLGSKQPADTEFNWKHCRAFRRQILHTQVGGDQTQSFKTANIHHRQFWRVLNAQCYAPSQTYNHISSRISMDHFDLVILLLNFYSLSLQTNVFPPNDGIWEEFRITKTLQEEKLQ